MIRRLALRTRDRRAILLGLIVVAPVLFYRGVASPYLRALNDVRARTVMQRDLLARERAMLAESHRYPTRIAEATTTLQVGTERLFAGPEPLSAAAALVNYVGQTARQHRVLVEQSETQTADPESSGVVTLEIAVQGRSDLEGLLGLLQGLEAGNKLVRVDELTIEQPQRLVRLRRDEEVLSFRARIVGYGLSRAVGGAHTPDVVTIGGAG